MPLQMIVGMDLQQQAQIDQAIVDLDKSRHKRRNRYITQGRRTIHRMTCAERVDSIRRTVYVSELDQTVVDCRICGDPRSVLRFAFVEFSDDDGARAALGLDGTILGFYPVRVSPSKTAILPVNPKYLPKTEDERKMVMRTIYYTNIDKMVTELDVKNFFVELCGEVSRLKLRGDNEHSTRITFVEFVRETQHFRGDGAACVERGARHAAENPLRFFTLCCFSYLFQRTSQHQCCCYCSVTATTAQHHTDTDRYREKRLIHVKCKLQLHRGTRKPTHYHICTMSLCPMKGR